MQTIDANDLVSGAFPRGMFEACIAFAPAPDGSPVCGACGWLDADHDQEVAAVHALPRRPHRVATPKRLAS